MRVIGTGRAVFIDRTRNTSRKELSKTRRWQFEFPEGKDLESMFKKMVMLSVAAVGMGVVMSGEAMAQYGRSHHHGGGCNVRPGYGYSGYGYSTYRPPVYGVPRYYPPVVRTVPVPVPVPRTSFYGGYSSGGFSSGYNGFSGSVPFGGYSNPGYFGNSGGTGFSVWYSR